MKFYTNISRISNNICYRGYEGGKRVSYREQFKPTLFISKASENSNWTTLDGKSLSPVQFDSMKEANDFSERYREVEEMKIYGNNNYAAQFIQENYPEDIQYDPKQVLIANIDIEVASDDGFPDPERAEKEVQAICLKYFGRSAVYVWACGDYDPSATELDTNPDDIYFIKCEGEVDLLLKFLTFWNHSDTCPTW